MDTNMRTLILSAVVVFLLFTVTASTADREFCAEGCSGKNQAIRRIRVLEPGARPRWAPDSRRIVFDRKNSDGFYDVYLMNLQGTVVRTLTEGKSGIGQRNNGNAIFHPSGRYIVFVSEEPNHSFGFIKSLGDPGLGLFSNLWATDVQGSRYWKLTDIELKKNRRDPTPIRGSVNPLFSPDGRQLLWTERYDDRPARWGRWRIKSADFIIEGGEPSLKNERVLYEPTKGNYVTAMGFIEGDLLVAGNLDGQHEYGMDLYRINLRTRALLNLTNTPEYWEEDASVTPKGRIIYMSNIASKYQFNRNDPNWHQQAMERDYFVMDARGDRKERLTYFNDSSAPEYAGKRVLAVASDMSPDGRYLAATLTIDRGTGAKREDLQLKVALIEMTDPL